MTLSRRTLVSALIAAQLAFAAISVIAYRTLPQGLIASDGKSYYAWLTSVALDGDLDFTNDFALIYSPTPPPTAPITPRGLVANKTSIGVALVETPGFFVGHAIAAITGQPRNGWSAPYQLAVTLWLQLLIVGALGLLWLGLLRLGADEVIAAIGVSSALLATNLLQYVARPAMSHGPGIAILCIAFYLAVSSSRPARPLKLAALGALLGLAIIIRASNAMLAPFFLVLFRPLLGRSLANWAAFLAGLAVPLAIQIGFASAQWGQLMYSSYGDEGFTAGIAGIIGSLFTARHGLFVYHPWYGVMLGLIVLAALRRETRALAVAALVCFAGFVVFNGTWWSWWFGDGFGNRSYVEIVPVLLVPAVLWLTAALKQRGQAVVRYATVVAVTLTIVNLVLWSGYILRRYPPNGDHTVAQAYLWWR